MSNNMTVVTPRRRPFCQVIDGVKRCPLISRERLNDIMKFVPQKGDVLQVAYPKTGSHWIQFTVQTIIHGGEAVESYDDFTTVTCFLDYIGLKDWERPSSTTIGLEIFGYGDYFEHLLYGYELKDKPNVLFLTYEEMKRDTRGTVLRIARFLGKHYAKELEENTQLLEDLLSKLTLWNIQGGSWGEIGGWKDYFNSDLLQRMEETIVSKTSSSDVMNIWADIREEARRLSNE
ncbi:hypothetical protein MRX96_015761 [Rhipicephalus microplus]